MMNREEIYSPFKVSEIQISYRNKVPAKDRPKILSSIDAWEILRPTWDDNKIQLMEQFKILLMDRNNACLGISEIATGGVSGVTADPKIIFGVVVKSKASGFIAAHNHPSGELKPSQADISLTKKLSEAAKFLDVTLLDHMIVAPKAYFSFADERLMPD